MIKTIKITPTRLLLIEGKNQIGVISENNAEILKFIKPIRINCEPIENFAMRVILETAGERYKVDMESDELPLDERYTGGDTLTVAVQFLKNNEVKWISLPLTLILLKSLPDDENYRNYLNFLKIESDGKTLDIEYEGNIDIQVVDGYLEVDY